MTGYDPATGDRHEWIKEYAGREILNPNAVAYNTFIVGGSHNAADDNIDMHTYRGALRDMRMYDRALSAAEVTTLQDDDGGGNRRLERSRTTTAAAAGDGSRDSPRGRALSASGGQAQGASVTISGGNDEVATWTGPGTCGGGWPGTVTLSGVTDTTVSGGSGEDNVVGDSVLEVNFKNSGIKQAKFTVVTSASPSHNGAQDKSFNVHFSFVKPDTDFDGNEWITLGRITAGTGGSSAELSFTALRCKPECTGVSDACTAADSPDTTTYGYDTMYNGNNFNAKKSYLADWKQGGYWGAARRSSAEHLIATKALRCTAHGLDPHCR